MQNISSDLLRTKSALLRSCEPQDAPACAWPMVCGSSVAEKTEAAGFNAGTLTIIVPDKGWRTELADLAPRYVAELNKISPVQIKSLIFIVREDFRPEA